MLSKLQGVYSLMYEEYTLFIGTYIKVLDNIFLERFRKSGF